MLFNSYIFIFLFLPLTLAGWYLLNHLKARESAKLFLAGMSLWFYGYFNVYYLAVIVASILGNYFLSCLMRFSKSRAFDKSVPLFLIGNSNMGNDKRFHRSA